MPRIARALLLLLLAPLVACTRPGTLDTSGPFELASAPDEGLRYFLTRDLLTVDAKVSQFHLVARERGLCVSRDSLATSWTLTVTTVADRRQAYRLGLRPSSTVDQTLGVKVSETGVLTSLNYAGTDQRAAIATTVARGVAGILGSLVRGGLGAARDTACAAPAKAKPVPILTRHVIRTFDLTELPPAPDPVASWSAITRQNATFTRDLELVALANLFVTVSPLPEPTLALEPAHGPSAKAIGCSAADSACARIFYREPIVRVVRVHLADATDARNTTFSVAEERMVALVSAADPILNISFGTQLLGDGKIALAFGDHGNVTGISQTSSAALNNGAAAVMAAGSAVREAYDAALKARIDELELQIKAAKDNSTLRSLTDSSTSPR